MGVGLKAMEEPGSWSHISDRLPPAASVLGDNAAISLTLSTQKAPVHDDDTISGKHGLSF